MATVIEMENPVLIDCWRKEHGSGLCFNDGDVSVFMDLNHLSFDQILDIMINTYNDGAEE